jgi:menaquinol-cytochrome c reductase iron-sulfur subunit
LLGLIFGLTGALGLGALAPVVGVLLWPLRRVTGFKWRTLGKVDEFPEGKVVHVTFEAPRPLPQSGYVAQNAAYLRREPDGGFVAFSIYCTHTGCPVNWQEHAQLFFCPCHAGVFDRNGQVAAGPPVVPLRRHRVRVVEGEVQLETKPMPFADLRS